ncbi:hypothetical protein [Deminuibacter soli]|uniref:TonB-dependent receptor plug domain-containing protein n=1 Tax=Deminuibacter soli TaxID=2291815 RepID=A0A3E1NGH4_9BACT|nr:hypothetical protein [Deminuibacter soli]RFM27066.1 hypothetical protein DXN05_16495 [Deminuibacter soli]
MKYYILALGGLLFGYMAHAQVSTPNNNPRQYTYKHEPLVIVDSVELKGANALQQLDPGIIQTMTVLKDSVATKKYGLRGQYGVILVSTKPEAHWKPAANTDNRQ